MDGKGEERGAREQVRGADKKGEKVEGEGME